MALKLAASRETSSFPRTGRRTARRPAATSRVAAESRRLQQTSRAVAAVDVLSSLAIAATRYDYVKPRVSASDVLHSAEGRHPIMERLLEELSFEATTLAGQTGN